MRMRDPVQWWTHRLFRSPFSSCIVLPWCRCGTEGKLGFAETGQLPETEYKKQKGQGPLGVTKFMILENHGL